MGANFVSVGTRFNERVIGRIEISIQSDSLRSLTLSSQEDVLGKLTHALSGALKSITDSLGDEMDFIDPQLIWKPPYKGEEATLKVVTLCLPKGKDE